MSKQEKKRDAQTGKAGSSRKRKREQKYLEPHSALDARIQAIDPRTGDVCSYLLVVCPYLITNTGVLITYTPVFADYSLVFADCMLVFADCMLVFAGCMPVFDHQYAGVLITYRLTRPYLLIIHSYLLIDARIC
jgi:hypothetical protein